MENKTGTSIFYFRWSENKTVFCPVLQRQVNGDDCFDISMVAEKTTPDRFLPKDLKPEDFTDDKKDICLKCKYHPE